MAVNLLQPPRRAGSFDDHDGLQVTTANTLAAADAAGELRETRNRPAPANSPATGRPPARTAPPGCAQATRRTAEPAGGCSVVRERGAALAACVVFRGTATTGPDTSRTSMRAWPAAGRVTRTVARSRSGLGNTDTDHSDEWGSSGALATGHGGSTARQPSSSPCGFCPAPTIPVPSALMPV